MLRKWTVLLASLTLVVGAAVFATSADKADALPSYQVVAGWPTLPDKSKLGPVAERHSSAVEGFAAVRPLVGVSGPMYYLKWRITWTHP